MYYIKVYLETVRDPLQRRAAAVCLGTMDVLQYCSPTTVATWVELRFDLTVAAPISKFYASSSGFIASCYETTMSTK